MHTSTGEENKKRQWKPQSIYFNTDKLLQSDHRKRAARVRASEPWRCAKKTLANQIAPGGDNKNVSPERSNLSPFLQ